MSKKPEQPSFNDDRIPDVSDFKEYTPFINEKRELEDYLDKTIVVHSGHFSRGSMGEFMVLTCREPNTENLFILTTGASQPMQFIKPYIENKRFPVKLMFTAIGNGYYIKSSKPDVT